jgi:signal transduction histidine kinase
MIKQIRTHLAWKILLTYLLVILVGIVVLAMATSLSVPAAFDRHIAGMSAMMSGNGMMGGQSGFRMDLFNGYQAAVTDALSLASLAALVAAVIASIFISRQVVGPIQKMTHASQLIAEGDYGKRLDISGNVDQVDELDQLALTFNQMADKLEKTEAMRRRLIGDVSHELRTPLTAIKGYMEGLIDGVLPPDPETYQQVYREADRLQRLVNDLQELSRVEAGAYPLKIEPVSVYQLVEQVVQHLGHQFQEKGVQLDTNLPPDLPFVAADNDRILQVLTNLVGNAMQYTPSGGKATITAERLKNEIQISVIDTGIGISPENLPLIFTRFYRADKSRARTSGGSGIGLTIAQALVFAHGGRIWAGSQGEGKGSSFHFTLPISSQS